MLDRLASITDLKNKDTLAQLVFDLDFDIPSPPPAPSVYVQPLDNGIRLVWGSEPVGTSSANINLNQDFHFQGIRVWQLASNSANANPTLLATYDVPDGVTTIYSDEFNPAKGKIERTLKMLGTDSGIPFSLDITDDKIRGGRLINNKEYFYAVTAYSYDLNNVAPYIVGLNQVGIISEVLESARKPISATPRSSSAIQSVTATQTSGNLLGGSVAIQQLAQNDITGHNYRVSFAPDESWTLRDLDTGQDLLTGETNLTGDFDYPVVDGFMPRVTAPNRGVARIFQQLANGDSVDLYPGKVDSSGVYYLDSETGDTTLGPFLFQDGVNPAFDNHDYEIRILPTASQNCWAYNFGDTSSVAPFLCPFEIYDLGACSYTDPSDDVKVTAMVRDDDASGDWTWGDRLYIRLIPYASVAWGNPATVSTDYVSDNSDQTLGRLGFILNDNSYLPNQIPPAETIRIRGGRFCVQDTFTFRSQKVGTAPGTIVKNDLNRIHAVPNPYYAHSQYELTQFDRVMKFTNIPASRKVTIRIFNLAGDLVRSIRREATTADQMAKAEIVWNLNTDAAVPVASGIYIFRIDVEGVGSKTDRLAVFVERERLDNF